MQAIELKRGAIAGIVAGIVFVMVEMAAVTTVMGMNPWGPPRMMAAIALGERALPPPETFDAGIVFVGMMVHFALSAVLGAGFAMAAARLCTSMAHAVLAGTLMGVVVYGVNFYAFTELFPWFAMARNAITIAAHAIFGAVMGWYYWRSRALASA